MIPICFNRGAIVWWEGLIILFCIDFLTPGVYTQRISVKKCNEYTNLFRDERVDAIFGDKSYGTVGCSKFSSGGTIIGGENAQSYQFPAMAALFYEDKESVRHKCGAVLISEEFLLTAAHCFKHKSPVKVVLGELNVGSKKLSPTRLEADIAEIIIHPKYRKNASHDDIALIRLTKKIPLRNGRRVAIRPACLATTEILESEIVTATGWGLVDSFGDVSPVLQTVNLPIVSRDECSTYFRDIPDFHIKFPGVENKENWRISSTQICAGDDGKDTCDGDSGGPLFYSPNKRHPCIRHVAGITSFGLKYCGFGTPGIYTKVSSYLNWIETHVWPIENRLHLFDFLNFSK